MSYSGDKIVCSVDHKAGAEHAKYHHRGHYLVGNKLKDAMLCEKPVLIVVYGVSEHRPDQDNEDSAKLHPDFFDVELDNSKGEVEHAPVEEQTVIHKCLENEVAEGRLTAESRAGIAHPHKSGGYGKSYDRRFDLGECLIELGEGNKNAHKRADVEGKLINADAAVAVGKWHDEEIGYIKSDSEACHNAKKGGFCFVALMAEYE